MHRVLLSMALLLAVGDVVGADTLTNEEIMARARQMALQAPTRECLLEVARAETGDHPAQALQDYRAAAAKPCPRGWQGGMDRDSDLRIAEAAARLGDADLAKRLLVPVCDGLLATSPPPQFIRYWYQGRAITLLRVAEDLFSLDRPRFEQALQKAQECLAQEVEGVGKQQALRRVLAVLALKEPETAIQRHKTELPRWYFQTDLIWNALPANPEVVLAHVDELMPKNSNLTGSPDGPSEGRVKGTLLAFVFRRDPAQAQQLAQQEDWFFWSGTNRGRLWLPLASAIVEMGAEKLPAGDACPKLYVAVMPELALQNADLALQVARSLPKPSDRLSALSGICRSLAPHDLERAVAAAREAMAMSDGDPRLSPYPLQTIAGALADTDADLTPELLKRLTAPRLIGSPFVKWWGKHSAAAEALLSTLTPAQQLQCITALLTTNEKTWQVADRRKWAERAMALSTFGQDAQSSQEVMLVVARFDPDLARQQWPRVKPALAARAPSEVENGSLEVLFAIGEGLEPRQAGGAAAEIAEITALLAAAPPERSWPYLYRMRLAHVYGYHDPEHCKRMVSEVIASLPTAPNRVYKQAVVSAGIRALGTVDLPAALKLFADTKEIQGDWKLLRDLMVAEGAAAPQAVVQTMCQLSPKPSLSNNLNDVMRRVARECPPECVHQVAVSWLQTKPPVGNPGPDVLRAVLWSARPEVIARIPEYLDLLPQDVSLAGVCGNQNLLFASDEVLANILSRLRALRSHDTPRAMTMIAAAKLERDWSGNQAMLNGLSPADQCAAILAIPEMRSQREWITQENQASEQ